MVVDARTGKITREIPGIKHAHGVALVPALRRAYVTNGHGDDVSVINLETLTTVGHIKVDGKNPDAVIYDNASGHVLAMNGDSNSISVIDPQLGKELTTIALVGNPEFAASDGSGNVYVNLEDKGELAHIDTKTNAVLRNWPLAPCEGPTGLALDQSHQRIFSVCANGWLIVTDATNGHQVAKIAVGKDPDAVAYDAATGMIFSPSRTGVLNIVRQIDADHYQAVEALPTMKSVRTLALDETHHIVYLVGAKVAERGKSVSGFTLFVVKAR
ncbi:MAG: YncE family protein [Rhodanobacter sp.]|nr:MAG: YncE family protein [Rhodanobacter sp.]TAM39912.1 MAG: YncE family protein [Rhodanobacter sp.]TAN27532.1 MAG: YncE family protein [Rhodanobacter sp.]